MYNVLYVVKLHFLWIHNKWIGGQDPPPQVCVLNEELGRNIFLIYYPTNVGKK